MTRRLPPNVSEGAKRRYKGSPKGTFLKQTGGDREKARELRNAERKLVQRNRLRRANKKAIRNGEEGWNTPKAIKQAESHNAYKKKDRKDRYGNTQGQSYRGSQGMKWKDNGSAAFTAATIVSNTTSKRNLKHVKNSKIASAAKRRTSVSGKRAV